MGTASLEQEMEQEGEARKVILVDMDGVLAHFDQGFLTAWRKKFPDEIYYELHDRTTFYIHEQYGVDLQDKVREITSAAGFFRNLPPVKGGIEAFNALTAQGHTVRICTAPLSETPTCLQEKYDWVRHYLGKQVANAMILSKDKTLIRGDYLIDDRPTITGKYLPEWEHVLFHAAYNAHVADRRRLLSWADCFSLLFSQKD